MWCNNCFCLFPLRSGSICLAILILIEAVLGAIFLLKYGDFYFSRYPEPLVFACTSFASAAMASLMTLGFAQSSWMLTRLAFYLWPASILLSAIRAILVIFLLNSNVAVITWECVNDGVLWPNATISSNSTATIAVLNMTAVALLPTTKLPSQLCASPHKVYIGMFLGLLADLALQIYAYFLTWQFLGDIKRYFAIASGFPGAFQSF
ncbi:uncharacterized protein L969DRAFT_55795 [Mixia osmundae IAM 14324]|uniref:MARVEL domain-containing protein n=1 Tax=Mixia osmundae (strain CBS 9802 / IAM 14324 / JCM 22182 / KY 12970) TaxID=764103 RepID=G7DSR4_MIXOS|nr:uncharacterized protein L969DRAFT_55795 [Mixia osmundae IAM 14324]KEI41804.1 hypothetical protein L969DRAFT_55795 [Mixia osmundae IAM 14324]GAA93622.1 hypothetical protein E5Q_00266 [Mixia osmundae IAM 14324]